MRSNRAKNTVHISMRITWPFKKAMMTWPKRAGITYTEFLKMSLVHGARIQAERLCVYEKIDDEHMQIISDEMEGI